MIQFKNTMTFNGAESQKKYNVEAGIPVNIDLKELKHLDKNDYDVVGKTVPQEDSKKK